MEARRPAVPRGPADRPRLARSTFHLYIRHHAVPAHHEACQHAMTVMETAAHADTVTACYEESSALPLAQLFQRGQQCAAQPPMRGLRLSCAGLLPHGHGQAGGSPRTTAVPLPSTVGHGRPFVFLQETKVSQSATRSARISAGSVIRGTARQCEARACMQDEIRRANHGSWNRSQIRSSSCADLRSTSSDEEQAVNTRHAGQGRASGALAVRVCSGAKPRRKQRTPPPRSCLRCTAPQQLQILEYVDPWRGCPGLSPDNPDNASSGPRGSSTAACCHNRQSTRAVTTSGTCDYTLYAS